jgi:hypothetical protein
MRESLISLFSSFVLGSPSGRPFTHAVVAPRLRFCSALFGPGVCADYTSHPVHTSSHHALVNSGLRLYLLGGLLGRPVVPWAPRRLPLAAHRSHYRLLAVLAGSPLGLPSIVSLPSRCCVGSRLGCPAGVRLFFRCAELVR